MSAPCAPAIKAAGCTLICQVQDVEAACEAVAAGADFIVAQGSEAGGHGAVRATLPLVPAVVDAVAPVPVLAAGGIADGRGLAAALMLGAHGVMIGHALFGGERIADARAGQGADRRRRRRRHRPDPRLRHRPRVWGVARTLHRARGAQ